MINIKIIGKHEQVFFTSAFNIEFYAPSYCKSCACNNIVWTSIVPRLRGRRESGLVSTACARACPPTRPGNEAMSRLGGYKEELETRLRRYRRRKHRATPETRKEGVKVILT